MWDDGRNDPVLWCFDHHPVVSCAVQCLSPGWGWVILIYGCRCGCIWAVLFGISTKDTVGCLLSNALVPRGGARITLLGTYRPRVVDHSSAMQSPDRQTDPASIRRRFLPIIPSHASPECQIQSPCLGSPSAMSQPHNASTGHVSIRQSAGSTRHATRTWPSSSAAPSGRRKTGQAGGV